MQPLLLVCLLVIVLLAFVAASGDQPEPERASNGVIVSKKRKGKGNLGESRGQLVAIPKKVELSSQDRAKLGASFKVAGLIAIVKASGDIDAALSSIINTNDEVNVDALLGSVAKEFPEKLKACRARAFERGRKLVHASEHGLIDTIKSLAYMPWISTQVYQAAIRAACNKPTATALIERATPMALNGLDGNDGHWKGCEWSDIIKDVRTIYGEVSIGFRRKRFPAYFIASETPTPVRINAVLYVSANAFRWYVRTLDVEQTVEALRVLCIRKSSNSSAEHALMIEELWKHLFSTIIHQKNEAVRLAKS